MAAIKKGATSAHRINSLLSFRPPRAILFEDCEELAARNLVIAVRNGRKTTRYFAKLTDALGPRKPPL